MRVVTTCCGQTKIRMPKMIARMPRTSHSHQTDLMNPLTAMTSSRSISLMSEVPFPMEH